MNVTFVKIRSWHALSGLVSRGGLEQTRCGRWVRVEGSLVDGGQEVHPTSDTLPAEKSCEVCLRLIAREADH